MINTPEELSSSSKSDNNIWESYGVQNSVESLISNKDLFLEERPMQPKRAIQEYVSQHGIRTPRRYKSLLEAVNSWKKFIIRSEHPQEYNGISWLSRSISIDTDDIIKYQSQRSTEELSQLPFSEQEIESGKTSDWEIIDAIKEYDFQRDAIKRIWFLDEKDILDAITLFSKWLFKWYAKRMWLSVDKVLWEQSYTFYEYIPGINHSVIADKDIPNRYYIISSSSDLKWYDYSSYMDWLIIQDGKIVNEAWGYYVWDARDNSKEIQNRRIFDHKALIERYNMVRNLWKFDSNHCPVMEFQTPSDNSSPYFLQYHRLRDKTCTIKDSFILDRELEQWEFESLYFRWVTPPEWLIIEAWFYYRWFNKTRKDLENSKWDLEELRKSIQEWIYPIHEEEASFDYHYDSIFSQIMSKKRLVNFGANFDRNDPFGWEVMKLCTGHASIATQFKSDLFITIPREIERKLYDYEKIYDLCNALRAPYRVKIRVISDWKKCYIKPITTKEEVEADYKKYVW